MYKAIVTSRTLKNKETGIDITVPEFRTISKLLTTQEEFHIIVISNLPYFKSVDHRPEDVVQFMVPKWYNDFEALHKAMSDRYPATIFPHLPKKLLLLKDSTPQGRRMAFDKLMGFMAASPKVCTSHVLLEFLGVHADKILLIEGKKSESGGGDTVDSGKTEDLMKSASPMKSPAKSGSSNLFGDEDSDDDELFKTPKDTEDEIVSDLFSLSPHSTPAHSNGTRNERELIFGNADAKVLSAEVEGTIYLPPGATVSVTSSEIPGLGDEDNSDLLNVEDDLDKLLNVRSNKKPTPSPKPKPPILAKPSGSTLPTKPPLKPRLSPPQKKPTVAPKPSKPSSPLGVLEQCTGDNMAEDDILKYIQENSEDADVKLDLF